MSQPGDGKDEIVKTNSEIVSTKKVALLNLLVQLFDGSRKTIVICVCL
ncbi:40182_t:CDS:2, partial [Gigaspora margarita]